MASRPSELARLRGAGPQLAGLLALLPLAACSRGPQPPAGPIVTVVVNDQLTFVPSTLVVPLGKVSLRIRNVGHVSHNLDIPALHAISATVAGGQTTYLTIHTTVARSYYFDCDFHVADGMVGTLVVRAPSRPSGSG